MLRQSSPYAASALARGSLLTLTALIGLLLTLGIALAQPASLVRAAPVDATVTVQDGERNYAGPASGCPGPDWNCVTPGAFPVLQIGTENVIIASEPGDCVNNEQEGGKNTFDCTIGDDPGEEILALQECGVSQDGTHNVAICKLTHANIEGLSPQCAVQRVSIIQTGTATVTNQLKADLRITQQLSSGPIQVQDGRQSVDVTQGASHKNQSDVEQVQIQTATGNATQQYQNAGCNAPIPPPIDDCADGGYPLTHPTTCAFITQEIPAGDSENIAKLKQEVKQQATTSNVLATIQQQGLPTGGNDADIHQAVPMTGGTNTEVVDQYTQQQLVAPGPAILDDLDQLQYEDPVCCGRRSQEGGQPGADSEELIGQTIVMQAGRDATQVASAKGVAQTPNGGCWISQTIQIEGASTSVSVGLPESCPEFDVLSNCTDSLFEGPGCETIVTCPSGSFFNEETGQCESSGD